LYYKTDTLITPTTFLKKCEKSNRGLYQGTEEVFCMVKKNHAFALTLINDNIRLHVPYSIAYLDIPIHVVRELN